MLNACSAGSWTVVHPETNGDAAVVFPSDAAPGFAGDTAARCGGRAVEVVTKNSTPERKVTIIFTQAFCKNRVVFTGIASQNNRFGPGSPPILAGISFFISKNAPGDLKNGPDCTPTAFRIVVGLFDRLHHWAGPEQSLACPALSINARRAVFSIKTTALSGLGVKQKRSGRTSVRRASRPAKLLQRLPRASAARITD